MGEINNIEWLPISSLKRYENNSKKHPEKQLRLIEKSIEEFGFISPCLIDEENNIIAGHGRTEAAQALGYDKVPCVRVEGLTEDQRKAYIIADNKLTELGGWDKEIVAAELAELNINDFNIDLTGFSFTEMQDFLEKQLEPYGSERQRTDKAYNLDILENTKITNDFWQMPIIQNDNYIPKTLLGFNYAKTSKQNECGIHFYLDDYQFERVWKTPEKYVDILKKYDCILSPDFSLYLDMPMPMKIWNVYRSRQIGAFFQSCGIKVIPTISWAEKDTFAFCFEGIPEGSIVSVSTIGVKGNKDAKQIWTNGMQAMIDKIKPSTILVYGGELDFDYGNINIVYFENKVTKEWEKGK